jgi:uncharacterized membrane protein
MAKIHYKESGKRMARNEAVFEAVLSKQSNDTMAVYIPQSYNFAGNLIVVPKEQVIPIDIDSGKVMTCVVSGGVSGF